MATLEQLFEEARSLSPDERRQLRVMLDRITEEEVSSRYASSRAREQQWLVEHRDEYIGQWVALEGNRLIVHGHDARAVYEAAREAGIRVPFLMRVKPADQRPFGGW